MLELWAGRYQWGNYQPTTGIHLSIKILVLSIHFRAASMFLLTTLSFCTCNSMPVNPIFPYVCLYYPILVNCFPQVWLKFLQAQQFHVVIWNEFLKVKVHVIIVRIEKSIREFKMTDEKTNVKFGEKRIKYSKLWI